MKEKLNTKFLSIVSVAAAILLITFTIQSANLLENGEEEILEDPDVEVMVGEMYFNQVGLDEENVIEVDEGDVIRFYNEGNQPHTVTIPELDHDEFVNPGEETFLRVDRVVEDILVNCELHTNHDATMTVSS